MASAGDGGQGRACSARPHLLDERKLQVGATRATVDSEHCEVAHGDDGLGVIGSKLILHGARLVGGLLHYMSM